MSDIYFLSLISRFAGGARDKPRHKKGSEAGRSKRGTLVIDKKVYI
jgi:hypothetical protein